MPPDPRVHVGVAAVVPLDGHLLMIRRGGVGEFASDGFGEWSVPGGWIDYPEGIEDAARREAEEESGVVVEPVAAGGHVLAYSSPMMTRRYAVVTLFVICRYVEGEARVVEPEKCPVVEWVPFAEVATRPLFDPLRQWWPVNGQHLPGWPR